jgi:seryl-tRNA synthetase
MPRRRTAARRQRFPSIGVYGVGTPAYNTRQPDPDDLPMHDLKWIRDNPEAFDAGLARRGVSIRAAAILALDAQRRRLQTELQEMQARRNEASKAIGAAKSKGQDASVLMAEVATLKTRVPEAEAAERKVGDELDGILASIPNLPASDVPEGHDEASNQEVKKHGTPQRFDFKPKEHDVIGTALGLMDFATAARLSGARFVVLSGALAHLERALGNLMLDMHTREFGYRETSPPMLVREETAFGTGNLPKSAEDMFQTTEIGRAHV